MLKHNRSPAELRTVFGDNLRSLSRDYPSISELSRRLGINRTQFNRYLSGESFPRPDVLDRICSFFDVDARILLDPVQALAPPQGNVVHSDYLKDFFDTGITRVTEDVFPSGFYRFTRRSFISEESFVLGIVHVHRIDGITYVKGYEPRAGMRFQGLSTYGPTREYRGYMTCHEDGVAFVLSRRNTLTYSFNYLARVSAAENSLWTGYVARTIRESESGERVLRMIYEYLGNDVSTAIAAARGCGFTSAPDIIPFHKRLLQLGTPFR
ncbi:MULTISPECIES: helix-turn-helix domain-containing protein [unclassified Epibacterium]|uniref:helix-turn-helix domain-containing protein n=1 Tax=unclassified Epibacterium TaxID=2639179 RepID=UPI001EF4D115|nr:MULTISPECIES: helix-turn-helix transcriptional regulator [unclassified Epibacterium]MCG7626197.1 helix-turn-helix domain-containing protein [Epibacterium sp. MM17-32]